MFVRLATVSCAALALGACLEKDPDFIEPETTFGSASDGSTGSTTGTASTASATTAGTTGSTSGTTSATGATSAGSTGPVSNCAAVFGGVPAYKDCGATATTCQFRVDMTAGENCTMVCAAAGWTCVDGLDAKPNGCGDDGFIGCDATMPLEQQCICEM